MKARCFPQSDIKSKDDRWGVYYASFNMEEYLSTLQYDDVTIFLNRHTSDLPKDAPMLDVGCGSGRHLVHLSNQGFTNLYGVDISSNGIRNLEQYRPGMHLQVADATNLPFADNSFEVVVMVGIVYEIPDAKLHEKVFKEIARVLRPGGRLLFINNSPYNFGERIYTFTQWVANLRRGEPMKFFVWRYQPRDTLSGLQTAGLNLREVWKANVRRGVFRFFYGVFVPRWVKEERQRRLKETNGQPYGLHEYYLVHSRPELLSSLGRAVASFSTRFLPGLFANSVCNLAVKPRALESRRG